MEANKYSFVAFFSNLLSYSEGSYINKTQLAWFILQLWMLYREEHLVTYVDI